MYKLSSFGAITVKDFDGNFLNIQYWKLDNDKVELEFGYEKHILSKETIKEIISLLESSI